MYSLLKINTDPGWVWNSCKYLADRPDADVHVLRAAIVPVRPALTGTLLRYKSIFTSIGIHLDNTNMFVTHYNSNLQPLSVHLCRGFRCLMVPRRPD